MKRLFVVALLISGFLPLVIVSDTQALGLKIAPLEYKATLKEGEKQQGFVDVSNPSAQPVAVMVSVQAFKQIDDDGGLQFFDDKRVADGIRPDIQTLDLGPREAARVFFTIDGTVLPEGDVYGALFFTTDPKQPRNGVGQLVRVGTILSLVNKNPGPREGRITTLAMPFIQLSQKANGTYRVRNTGPENSGFYPTVEVLSWPSGKAKRIDSSLVFGGRERSNDFTYDAGYGIHKITASYANSSQTRWVILIAPWMIVLIILVTLIVGVEILLLKRRRKMSRQRTAQKSS